MAKTPSRQPPLGELELAVIEHLWIQRDADVHETQAAVGKPRGISPNRWSGFTRSASLSREKVSHMHTAFRAAVERETFRARKLIEAAGGLRALRRSGLLAAFVDPVADSDGAALLELERLIRVRREASEP